MSDYQRDEDRLPWLEPVDDYEDVEAIPMTRLIGAVVVGLVALGLVIGGIFWFRNRDTGSGNGALIEAPAGPIKERPQESGGLAVEGTGDVAYGASVGEEINSVIDASAVPEEPVIDARAAPKPEPKKPAAAPKSVTSAKIEAAKPAAKPAVTAKPGVTVALSGGGSVIQLGAFSSPALANKAWGELAKRFSYLSGASHELSPVTVNGKTLYRLRANVGGQAGSVCAKLKVAGEACSVL